MRSLFEERFAELVIDTERLIEIAIVLALVITIALVVHWVLFQIIGRLARLSRNEVDDVVVAKIRQPMRWAIVGFAISLAEAGNLLRADWWVSAVRFVVPFLAGWVFYALIKGVALALERQAENAPDPVAKRSQRTRIAILSRTAQIVIVIITAALIMLNIPGVRDIGVTLMASAGLAALAVGAAAQPALKSLISGLQLALTQTLRIGDLVKVDGEIGRVEEIRMSFVTVRSWDERVLIVPTSRFLDESFENWSRISERLTGPVYLHLDPATETGPIRAEFERYVETHPLWDGRTNAMLMTEAHPESMELRLAVSSATIGDLWQLRCEVREHMITWLQANQPEALIRHRLEVQAANERVQS
jgi:small-conductance mechanosensitive channel